ncbi:toxin-antitoxin system, toxin component [Streptomyces sp. NPDC086080]|uniref:toxin-antitoxin system, toxin component n=1 Tax=Streptomyces sp. NPDC086080 TaxID=3365748 RepID=UPI0037D52A45
MRKLSAELVSNLRPLAGDADVVPAIGRALSLVRGRPVQLRGAAFPPATASGLWVDRADHDLIVYEETTDPEHQIVIIGHETWHMFQGHGADATRAAAGTEAAGEPAGLVTAVAEAARTGCRPARRMDVGLHFAARTDGREVREEREAEHFGFRFATGVQAALDGARRDAGDPRNLTGRIHASMAHRFRPV